ncbi:DUF2514 family protein [Roseateles sp.]|uniref:DUF2514 family protein n=1 Tax=Roseateles sp. TaxID=1971397 RepID=UPI0031D997AF
MKALIERLLTPVLALALLAALVLAGVQWRAALVARAATDKVTADFATYRADAERNHAQAIELRAKVAAQRDKQRQEAIDAEHTARVAAEADAARLRASSGQLQRYATDLATSLGDRARESAAAAGSCPSASAAAGLLADVLGRMDAAAERVVLYADQARLAGQLCERTYDALMP